MSDLRAALVRSLGYLPPMPNWSAAFEAAVDAAAEEGERRRDELPTDSEAALMDLQEENRRAAAERWLT